MTRSLILCLACLSSSPGLIFAAQGEWKTVEGEAFAFTEIREGIWSATATDSTTAWANVAVVISEHEVLVVDPPMTRAAGLAFLADLPRVTEKPVRWVVNTHPHLDHTYGNGVFGPEVEIIAHEVTYQNLTTDPLGPNWDDWSSARL